jgi:hypothetical protein
MPSPMSASFSLVDPSSAPLQPEAATANPASNTLPMGPGMSRHMGLYRNAVKNPVAKMLTEQLRSNAGSGTASMGTNKTDDAAAGVYKKAKDGAKSGALLGTTGLTLFAEAGVHMTNSVHKEALRVAIGQSQKYLGAAGAAYYGLKAAQNKDWQSAVLSLGYAAFGMEGWFRKLESHSIDPVSGDVIMPRTGFFGCLAPILKSQFECSYANLADLFANLIEARHATLEPQEKGFPKALWNLAHSLKPRNIATVQFVGGLGMLGTAAAKIHTYLNTNPPHDPAQVEKARKELEVFENKITNACARLEADDKEFTEKVESVFASKTDEEFSRKFQKLFDSCAELPKAADKDFMKKVESVCHSMTGEGLGRKFQKLFDSRAEPSKPTPAA